MEEVAIFDRIYIPPYCNGRDKIERLVLFAFDHGFKCPERPGVSPIEQIQELTKKKNHYLVLEKFENTLTIMEKSTDQVMRHIGQLDVKIYSPERAIEWIIATTQKVQL